MKRNNINEACHEACCNDIKPYNHGHDHSHGQVHDHDNCHDHNHEHDHGHCDGDEPAHCLCHSHGHDHDGHSELESHGVKGFCRRYLRELISGGMLLAGIVASALGVMPEGWVEAVWYALAMLPVAWEIIAAAWRLWVRGDIFNEFTLMLLAAVGAAAIGEWPEAVAVLLFYSFGEKLQDQAADDVRRRVRSLIGRMPKSVNIIDAATGDERAVKPEDVEPGMVMNVRPGERVALDATLRGSEAIDFDTSAITGESVPRAFEPGAEVAAGSIPVDHAVRLTAVRPYSDSTLSRIMRMIDEAASAHTPTETMLRRITRWFTPTVIALAIGVFIVPWIVSLVSGGSFEALTWFRRALVFLVCACPCALVVSIPLSYFASLGKAARMGVLFKGASHIDALRDIDTVVLDKTGTVTTGRFSVEHLTGPDPQLALLMAASLNRSSSHPLAQAVIAEAEARKLNIPEADEATTISHGMRGRVAGRDVVAGSPRLMAERGIAGPEAANGATTICVAVDNRYVGSIELADTVKPEAAEAIKELHALGVKDIEILSGDYQGAVERTAAAVGADSFRAEMMPNDKYRRISDLRAEGHSIAFAGDGINDAPSLAAANVGIAMGAAGTDMALESADMVISTDNLLKIPQALRLARKARRVVMENVGFAFGVKALVMILAAMGVATLWAGVFADTGVTVIAVIWTLLRLRS